MEWVVAGILIIVAVAVLAFVAVAMTKRSRYSRLMQKYADEKLVDALISKTIWQGMTAEQLRDSWGEPASIEEKVMKTKIKQVFKYRPVAANRFRDKVTLEDGIIVGWDQK
jgi:NO-binding membrane sensor protein with MHYT domain